MFIKPSIILNMQNDLSSFANLCNEYNYKPTEQEIKEIINYLLVVQNYSMNGTMTESVNQKELDDFAFKFLNNHFNYMLTEARGGEYEEGDELTSLVNAGFATIKGALGLVGSAAGAIGLGGGVAAGGMFLFLSFMFKKGKIRSIIKDMDKLNQDNLKDFEALVKLEEAKAKLTNAEVSGLSNYIPTYL